MPPMLSPICESRSWVTLVVAVEPVSHNFPVSFGAEQSLRLICETKFICSDLQDADSKQ